MYSKSKHQETFINGIYIQFGRKFARMFGIFIWKRSNNILFEQKMLIIVILFLKIGPKLMCIFNKLILYSVFFSVYLPKHV